jgi:hypothetical protein
MLIVRFNGALYGGRRWEKKGANDNYYDYYDYDDDNDDEPISIMELFLTPSPLLLPQTQGDGGVNNMGML